LSTLKKSFNGKIWRVAFILMSCLAVASIITTGCDMFGGDSSSDNAVTTQYTISGTIVSPVTNAPVPGVTCTLAPDSSVGVSAFADQTLKTTVTDSNGAYSFSGVQSGKYKITSAGNDLVPTTTKFNVNSDTKHSIKQVSKSEWAKLVGNDNPYDPAKAYITVHTDAYPPLSAGTEDSGVTVDLKRSVSTTENQLAAYEAKGHLTSNGTIDWSATKTYDNGTTFFRGVAANQPHTITAQKDRYTFETIADAAAAPGEITHVILKGTPVAEGFPVTIVNNSGYKTEEVYIAITGQDRSGNYYYFDPTVKDMVIGTTDSGGTKWCFNFSKLDSTVENQFSYTHPFNNMIGGRVWVFIGKSGVFGVNKNDKKEYDAKLMVQPSYQSSDYKNVIFDKIELTCDGTNVTSNTTIVDYLSIPFNLKTAVGTEKGFKLTGVLTEMETALTNAGGNWSKCVYKNGNSIVRITSPIAMSEFSSFFDSAVKKGWEFYMTNKITFKYSDWTYESLTTQENKLAFRVIKDWGAVKASGEVYVIDSMPSSDVVWRCDGAPLANSGTAAQKNLHACISAALNRGVFCDNSYTSEVEMGWGETKNFYKTTTQNDGKYNVYAQVLHEKAINNLVYGFPYDDHFGKDPTMVISYANAKKGVTLTIPKLK